LKCLGKTDTIEAHFIDVNLPVRKE
jgi:hypothetical protein